MRSYSDGIIKLKSMKFAQMKLGYEIVNKMMRCDVEIKSNAVMRGIKCKWKRCNKMRLWNGYVVSGRMS